MAQPISTLYVELRARLDKFNKDMKGVAGALQGVGSKLQGIGSTLTRSISVPIAGAGIAALKMATDFNRAMANIATLMPGNTKRVEELKTAIQDMAVSSGKSTDELANGLYQVISAFGDSEDAVKMLDISNRAAIAGLATTEDALNLISAVTQGYGDTTLEAQQKVSDMAFVAAKVGKTTFPEMAEAMGKVIPIAKALNVSQEEMFGVMATLTGVTGSTSEVVTQFRAGLQSLMAPTETMQGLFDKLGVKSGEALLKQVSFSDAMKLVAKASKESGIPLQKFIGQVEGQVLALALSGAQADRYKMAMDEMGRSMGATDAAFKAQTEGIGSVGTEWNKLLQSLRVTAQQIGDALILAFGGQEGVAGAMASLREGITSIGQAFKNADPEVVKTVATIAGIAIAVGPVLKVVGLLVSGLSYLVPVLGAVGGAILLLFTPLGLLAAAVGVAIAVWYEWDNVKLIFGAVIDWIGEKLSQAIQWVKDFATNTLNTIVQWGTDTWNSFETALKGWEQSFGNWIKGNVQAIRDWGVQVIEIVKQTIADVGKWFTDGFNSIKETLSAPFDYVVERARAMKSALFDESPIPETVAGLTKFGKDMNSAMVPAAKTATGEVVSAFEKMSQGVDSFAASIGTSMDKGAKKAEASAKKLQKEMQKTADEIATINRNIDDAFDDLAGKGTGSVSEGLQGKIEGFLKAGDVEALKALGQSFRGNKDELARFNDELKEGVANMKNVQRESEALAKEVTTTGQAISKAFGKDSMSALGKQIADMLKSGNEAGVRKLYEDFDDTTEKSNEFNSALQEAESSIGNLRDTSRQWAEEMSGAFASLGEALGLSGQGAKALGDFLGGAFSGQGSNQNASGWGAAVGNWVSGLFSSSPSTSDAHAAGVQGPGMADGSFGSAIDSAGSSGGGSGPSVGYGTYIQAAAAGIQSYNDARKEFSGQYNEQRKAVMEGIHTTGMMVANAWTFGLASVVEGIVGRENMEKLSIGKHIVNALFGENIETWARHQFANFVEERLQKLGEVMLYDANGKLQKVKGSEFNFLEGSKSRFNPNGDVGGTNWGDNFAAMGKESMGFFTGLGMAFKELLGITQDIAPQIGYLIATNLNGNIDNARLFVQQLGIAQEDMMKALTEAAANGDMTWHEYNVAVQSVTEAYKEGLVAVGAYKQAFDMIVDSGGKGMGAVKGFRDMAVEALEKGLKSMDELKAKLIAEGADPEYVNAIFEAAAARGITSLEAMRDSSTETAGAIIGDAYAISDSLAKRWDEMNKVLEDVNSKIAAIPDKVEKSVVIDVEVNDPNGALDKLSNSGGDSSVPTEPVQNHAKGAVFQSARMMKGIDGMHRFAEAGAEAIMPLTRINGKLGVLASGMGGGTPISIVVNAPNAELGVEERIKDTLMGMKDLIVDEAVEMVHAQGRRAGFSR